MKNSLVADLLRTQERFLRSIHLERDFDDQFALSGYILTPRTQQHFNELAKGLHIDSGRRAWRITGDFGVGKSAFALYLARLLSGQNKGLPSTLRQTSTLQATGGKRPRLLPVLVTGSREPLTLALLNAIRQKLAEVGTSTARILKKFDQALAAGAPVSDDMAMRLVVAAAEHVVSEGLGTGILIVLDELGKFLEYAALNPAEQDVYFLQQLGERASRSKGNAIFVVGLLHQGFSEYASNLNVSAQKEWEKVAGRFEELVFDQPMEQVAGIVAAALNIDERRLSPKSSKAMISGMDAALELKWYGPGASEKNLLDLAVRLYPLHPTVLPVLTYVFSRFGQNQRSLFSFLVSEEPLALKDFAQIPLSNNRFYRLPDLYDFVRHAFSHQLSFQNYRSHWNLIESTIEAYSSGSPLQLKILKTVGLLNLLERPGFISSEDAIVSSLSGGTHAAVEIRESIDQLRKSNILYFRGVAGGYALWSHTSVNLEASYENAVTALGKRPPDRVSSLIGEYLESRPVVARRHYIETGNLRHFEVSFVGPDELDSALSLDFQKADGRIIVPLCENVEDLLIAESFAKSDFLRARSELIIAVPRPLSVLGRLFQETRLWEWVLSNTPGLNNDQFARNEASKQFDNAKQNLLKRLTSLLGIQGSAQDSELRWFHKTKRAPIEGNRKLQEFVSRVCDEIYYDAPLLHNELINRREPSSAAVGARTRLLQGIFERSDHAYLGMQIGKKPPEMSMYLSLLRETGLHTDGRGFCFPEQGRDIYNLMPVFNRLLELFTGRPDSRINLIDVIAELRRPPFGLRDGVVPILIAVFAMIHESHIAFYYDGRFLNKIAGLDSKLFSKVPQNFDIQYCRVEGARSELFGLLLRVVLELKGQDYKRIEKDADVLSVVRPLSVFAANLPTYTIKTPHISPAALAVRRTLLDAKEPGPLLFEQLPIACGFEPVRKDSPVAAMEAFVNSLRGALDEIKFAFAALHDRMRDRIVKAFELSDFGQKKTLSERAGSILKFATETQLKGFCLCLQDTHLNDPDWLNALGSYVCSVPPKQWLPIDEEKFAQELSVLAGQFRRVESIVSTLTDRPRSSSALRLSVTNVDGTELDDLIFFDETEESMIAEIEVRMLKVLDGTDRLGKAAAARAISKVLSSRSRLLT